ncbi:hypothetical protein A1F94_006223 [Pyrenophora tritici-repentis]|nr:hypothetical protein A1F94_006223 [Pyrenophora tritici-repentis]
MAKRSRAGTAATTEASVDTEPDNGDNFDGINWDRLPRFMKPLTTGRRVKSWIFQHGYRVVELYDQNRVWFVCKYCHIHKVIDTGGSGVFDGSNSLRQTLETGVAVSQEAANAMGNFNIQQFREVAVFCLLDNNLPMELLARPSFREMISLANPEAEAALWKLQARSISFDGWTTKGGKRGFFGVVAHFANASGVIQDLPIALPHLAGSHTGDAIADTIKRRSKNTVLGVINSATSSSTMLQTTILQSPRSPTRTTSTLLTDASAAALTLNLIGQAIIFGSNQEAYNNNDEQLQTEEVLLLRWNSYYAAFKRATQLQAAYNSYAEHYINALSLKIAALVNDCLELKLATEKLEGRGKAGKYGIYETIPVFEYVLGALEARTRSYEQVDFNPPDAPEDHLFVNLRAAWSKANDYYNKLDRSPAYYAATCLHPYYKYYCENSWVDKPEWLTSANAGFLQLWQSYKPQRTRPLSQTTAKPRHRGIDDVEAAHDDEYERWRTQEPEWTSEQYLSDGHSQHLVATARGSLASLAIYLSRAGELLAASYLLLQLVRSWRRAGFDGLYNNGDDEDKWSDVKDEEIVQQYDIEGWSTTP